MKLLKFMSEFSKIEEYNINILKQTIPQRVCSLTKKIYSDPGVIKV